MNTQWIIDMPVAYVDSDGSRHIGRIAVGPPVTAEKGGFTCLVALDGLHYQMYPIYGSTALQALVLSIQFVGSMLYNFVASGGQVQDQDSGTDIRADVILGPLFC